MKTSIFRECFVFSFACHGVCAALFVFSFGTPIQKPYYARTFFLGNLIQSRDLAPAAAGRTGRVREEGRALSPRNARERTPLPNNLAQKPLSRIPSPSQKAVFLPPIQPLPAPKEPGLIFYPELPASFLLYFKDIQQAHIELLCRVDQERERGTVTVKRRISSGNLAADLLSMRYLSHYLSLQQARFSPGVWHPVKIDLSPGEGRQEYNDHY